MKIVRTAILGSNFTASYKKRVHQGIGAIEAFKVRKCKK